MPSVTPVNVTGYSPASVPLPRAVTPANVKPATLGVKPSTVFSVPSYVSVPLFAASVTPAASIVSVPSTVVTR